MVFLAMRPSDHTTFIARSHEHHRCHHRAAMDADVGCCVGHAFGRRDTERRSESAHVRRPEQIANRTRPLRERRGITVPLPFTPP